MYGTKQEKVFETLVLRGVKGIRAVPVDKASGDSYMVSALATAVSKAVDEIMDGLAR